MKISTKFIIAGGILLTVGVIGFIIGMSLIGWDFRKLDTEKFENMQKVYAADATANITEINIDIERGGIKFVFDDTDAITVDYAESEHTQYDFKLEGGVLTLSQTYGWHFKIFNFRAGQILMTVTMPKQSYKLSAETHNGEIALDGSDLQFGDVYLHSQNGKITAKNLTAPSLDARTSNGTVDISNATVMGNVTLSSSNGKITATNVTSNALRMTTSNGSVTGANCTANIFHGESSNGTVTTVSLACPDIYLSTNNGTINANIKGASTDYRKEFLAHNGKTSGDFQHYPNGTKKLFASSGNGNIIISFTE